KRNAAPHQHTNFLAASAENKWVAALQSANRHPLPGVVDHERVNRFLLIVFKTSALSDVDDKRMTPGLTNQFCRDQPIVQDDIGAANRSQAIDRDQTGVARTCADDINETGSALIRFQPGFLLSN